jgi:hypothetical protein
MTIIMQPARQTGLESCITSLLCRQHFTPDWNVVLAHMALPTIYAALKSFPNIYISLILEPLLWNSLPLLCEGGFVDRISGKARSVNTCGLPHQFFPVDLPPSFYASFFMSSFEVWRALTQLIKCTTLLLWIVWIKERGVLPSWLLSSEPTHSVFHHFGLGMCH